MFALNAQIAKQNSQNGNCLFFFTRQSVT